MTIAKPTTAVRTIELTPTAELPFLPDPVLVLFPLGAEPDPLGVEPFTSWLTTEDETPGEFLHASPLRRLALVRKVMSAHCESSLASTYPFPPSLPGAGSGARTDADLTFPFWPYRNLTMR